jgi:hypothetical protein
VPSDLDLLDIQVQALFRHDEHGRLLSTNEEDPPPAPRLFLGRTRQGNIWRVRHDLPEPLVAALEGLLTAEPVVADLSQPVGCLSALMALLESEGRPAAVSSGPAFAFPSQLSRPEHDVVRITAEHHELVRRAFPTLARYLPSCQPCLAIVREGRLASLCFSARNTPLAAEAGVNTVEAFRGRGYAGAVVSAWAATVRQEGRIPLYSTSWHNQASRAVARKLDLVQYGEDLEIA